MRNRLYGGVRGRKMKVGGKLLHFPPTRLLLLYCSIFFLALLCLFENSLCLCLCTPPLLFFACIIMLFAAYLIEGWESGDQLFLTINAKKNYISTFF